MSIKNFLKKILPEKKIVIETKYTTVDKVLEGKRALVVGGGTGIGLAIAKKLKDAGAEVIVASRSKHGENEQLAYEIWDVEVAGEIKVKFWHIAEKYGQIDIVVNSQGICPRVDFVKNVNEIDVDDFDKVININLRSVYFMCQVACEYFKEKNIRGHILNIASTEGMRGAVVPYGISKAGVISLTQGWGKQEVVNGIIINGIAPGATATAMMRLEDACNLNVGHIPSGRMSTPEEIANVALLLVSDMGNNMCGVVVTVDGGESLH